MRSRGMWDTAAQRRWFTRTCGGVAGAACLGLVVTPAAAQLDISAGIHASTLGIGVDGDILLSSHLGARVIYNGFYSYSTSKVYQANTYDGKLTYQNIPILLDYYFTARGYFHLTGGIVLNQNKVETTALLPWTYGGTTWTSADLTAAPTGTVTWPSTGWYAGLGYGSPVHKGSHLGFIFDVGVLGGAPTVKLNATATNPALNGQLQTDLQQAADSIQKDLKKFATYYPVISIGINYKF